MSSEYNVYLCSQPFNGNYTKWWIAAADDLEEAERLVASPPLSAESLMKVKRGMYILATYTDDEVATDTATELERVAVLGRVIYAARRNKAMRVAVCSGDKCTLDGDIVSTNMLGTPRVVVVEDEDDGHVKRKYKDWCMLWHNETAYVLLEMLGLMPIESRLVVKAAITAIDINNIVVKEFVDTVTHWISDRRGSIQHLRGKSRNAAIMYILGIGLYHPEALRHPWITIDRHSYVFGTSGSTQMADSIRDCIGLQEFLWAAILSKSLSS